MNNQNQELKKAGLKATLPRIKIMEVLASTAIQEEAHFSAEDIYKELLANGENIGLASVYRVLTQFESAGMVKKHHFEGSHAVYEVIEEHHEHMVDVETGKVLEFQDQELTEGYKGTVALQAKDGRVWPPLAGSLPLPRLLGAPLAAALQPVLRRRVAHAFAHGPPTRPCGSGRGLHMRLAHAVAHAVAHAGWRVA